MATVKVIVSGQTTAQATIAGAGRVSANVVIPGRSTAQAIVVGQGSAVAVIPLSSRTEAALPLSSVQFNNAGHFAGSSAFLYDDSTKKLTLSGAGALFSIHSTSPSSNLFSIHSNGTELLRVDGANKKLIFNGTGYFDNLYVGGSEIASKALVTGVSGYLNEKTNFLFQTADVTSGATSQFVNFGQNLGYQPRVVAELIIPGNQDVVYFIGIDRITPSGFNVGYSSQIAATGYLLEYFVSSKHFSV